MSFILLAEKMRCVLSWCGDKMHEVIIQYTDLVNISVNHVNWLCEKDIEFNWSTIDARHRDINGAIFYFENKKDALMFKLVWG